MKIGGTKIGRDSVYFIAEAGVNHNGDIDKALELIDIAAEGGADAVKFQTFRAEYTVTGDDERFEKIKQLELTEDEHRQLVERCRKTDLTFLSTPTSHPANVDLLMNIGTPAIKIGSGEITNKPLLEYSAAQGVPMIVSTGMSTMDEIHAAHDLIRAVNPHIDVAFLHCVSCYPATIDDLNLRKMDLLREELPAPIGFSDHSTSVTVPGFAVARGARIIEKHVTIDKQMSGPDHGMSLEPDELETAVRNARDAARAKGERIRVPIDCEREIIDRARRSLHLTRDVEAGDTFSRDHVAVKRPNVGLSPMRIDQFIGAEYTRAVASGEPLTEDALDL
jgi:N-acetylneuraminate synthase/N,N'-diacetyllegionaminate synthase